jgi:hypothetical protein
MRLNLFFATLMRLAVVLRGIALMAILRSKRIIVCCRRIYVRITCFANACGFFGMVEGFL